MKEKQKMTNPLSKVIWSKFKNNSAKAIGTYEAADNLTKHLKFDSEDKLYEFLNELDTYTQFYLEKIHFTEDNPKLAKERDKGTECIEALKILQQRIQDLSPEYRFLLMGMSSNKVHQDFETHTANFLKELEDIHLHNMGYIHEISNGSFKLTGLSNKEISRSMARTIMDLMRKYSSSIINSGSDDSSTGTRKGAAYDTCREFFELYRIEDKNIALSEVKDYAPKSTNN